MYDIRRDSDLRILRDRQNALADEIGRLERPQSPGTKKHLVQVNTNGSFPTSNGKWFICNPVVFDADETEGGSATLSADGFSQIPVLVIGSRTTNVAEYLLAHNIGGKWVAERGICCTAFTVVCGSTAVSGAVVSIKSGPTTLASGTTDSSGVVRLCVPSGTYTVTATATGQTPFSQSMSLACGGQTIQMCSGIVCGHCSIPTTLNLTDGGGTIPIVYQPGTSVWLGCYLLPTSDGLTPCQLQGQPGGPSSGSTPIVYQVTFTSSGTGCIVEILRSWSGGGGSTPALPCGYCIGSTLDASCSPSTQSCPPPFNNRPCTGSNDDGYGPASTGCPSSIFPLSVTLTNGFFFNSNCPGGIGLGSPLGTGVVIDV